MVGNSAGTTPLAGGSGIGISASDTGIPQISVGKPSEERYCFLVKKTESEFPITEFRYIINVGLSIITQRQETTRHKKMFRPGRLKDTRMGSLGGCLGWIVVWLIGPPPETNLVCLLPITGHPPPGIIRCATLLARDVWRGWTQIRR